MRLQFSLQQQKQLLQSDLQQVRGFLPDMFKRYNLLPKLNDLIEQAGLRWSPLRTVHLCLALFIAGAGFCWFLLPSQFKAFSLIAGTLASALPIIYLMRARKSRLHRWEELFPESLEFVARSMRAGHARQCAIGVRMSGEPICATTERSLNSTRP